MTSSTMMSHRAWLRSALMFSANDASLVKAVAKPRLALGARSWTISSMAVPSSPWPA